jgi:hypothetical protein
MATTVKTQTLGMRATFVASFRTAKAEAVGALVTIEAAGVATMTALKAAVVSLFAVAWPLLIGTAVVFLITHFDTVKRYGLAVIDALTAGWHAFTTTIIGIGKLIGGSLALYLVEPIKLFIDVASHIPSWLLPFGLATQVQDAKKAIDGLGSSLTSLVVSGKNEIVRGASDFSSIPRAFEDALKKTANDPATKDAAKQTGKTLGTNMAQTAGQAITATMPSVQKAISDALQNAVASAHKAIQTAVQDAKNNLDKIGQDLAKTISDIQAKIGGAAGAIAGSPQGAAFAKLKKLIEEGAPAFEIQKAQAELAGQLQNVGKTQKQQVSSQLANLTAAFNKGQIGYKEFESRLHKILHDDGITMAQALKAGGPAFADAFKAEVAALGKQAQAIAALPAKFRGIGGAGGAADLKIIQPLQVIKQEQLKVRTAVEKAAAAAEKQRASIIKNQQKQIQEAAAAKSVGAKVVFHHAPQKPGGISRTTEVLRARTRTVLTQIRDHVKRTADNTARLLRGPAGPLGPIGVPSGRHRAERHAEAVLIKGAIQTQHTDLLRGLRDVCNDIAAADKDIVALQLAFAHPVETLRRTELRIANEASQQRDRQIRLQSQTNTLLQKLNRDKGVPGFNKERPGTGSKHARMAAAAGVKP